MKERVDKAKEELSQCNRSMIKFLQQNVGHCLDQESIHRKKELDEEYAIAKAELDRRNIQLTNEKLARVREDKIIREKRIAAQKMMSDKWANHRMLVAKLK